MYAKRYYVQSLEDFSFLRADGEGGVETTPLITRAMSFDTAEAAHEAVMDHLSGEAVVFQVIEEV